MAKNKENAQTAENAQTDENAQKEEKVTLTKAELEGLLADVKLMKEKLASEERRRGVEDRILLQEEEERARVIESNRRAMELVSYHAEMGSLRSNKNLEVAVNGKQYLIQRGQTVMIPRCVKEVLDNAQKQLDSAYGLQEQKADEFARQELEMARVS